MGCQREHVIWQREDMTWLAGFFTFHETGFGDDFDHEWDVEYDKDSFWFVSSKGHPSEDAAEAEYLCYHSNPDGASEVLEYTAENAARILELEGLYAKALAQGKAPQPSGLTRW